MLAEYRIAEGIASHDPERLRLKIVEPAADLFAEGVLEMLKPLAPCPECKRSGRRLGWYRLFAKIAKLVDSGPSTIVLAIWQQLGVRDESEARALIGMAKSVDGLEPQVAAEQALAHLQEFYRTQGKRVVVLDEAPEASAEVNGDAQPIGGGDAGQ